MGRNLYKPKGKNDTYNFKMSLEEKLSKTAKFTATGLVGTVAYMTAGYSLGSLLQGTYIDTGLKEVFNIFNVNYYNLKTLLTFIGFSTGLKMTALLEFYNTYPKVRDVYNKIKGHIKKVYHNLEEKERGLEEKFKKTSLRPKLKSFGKYLLCGGIGLGLGKLVGEGFERISYTDQAFTYLFNRFADIHFNELGDLFTLLGMIWGFRFKPQLELLYFYWTDKEKYNRIISSEKI